MNCFFEGFEGMPKERIAALNPLVLAYIGDCVHSLFVRTQLVINTDAKACALHRATSLQVCAAAQARKADKLLQLFNENENAIYKRARNSHANTKPKNAKLSDYMKASGLEAVFGYLYLIGEHGRLDELLAYAEEMEKK